MKRYIFLMLVTLLLWSHKANSSVYFNLEIRISGADFYYDISYLDERLYVIEKFSRTKFTLKWCELEYDEISAVELAAVFPESNSQAALDFYEYSRSIYWEEGISFRVYIHDESVSYEYLVSQRFDAEGLEFIRELLGVIVSSSCSLKGRSVIADLSLGKFENNRN